MLVAGLTVTGSRITPASYFFHLQHFPGLLFGAHVLVDDAHAALCGQGDCQAGFRDGIHGRGNQGDIELDARRQACLEADLLGQDPGMGRDQQDIVKGKGLFDYSHDLLYNYESGIKEKKGTDLNLSPLK